MICPYIDEGWKKRKVIDHGEGVASFLLTAFTNINMTTSGEVNITTQKTVIVTIKMTFFGVNITANVQSMRLLIFGQCDS